LWFFLCEALQTTPMHVCASPVCEFNAFVETEHSSQKGSQEGREREEKEGGEGLGVNKCRASSANVAQRSRQMTNQPTTPDSSTMSSYFEDASHWRTARQSPLLQQDEHHAPAPETTAAPANHLNVARALLKPRLIFTLGLLTLLLLAAAMLLRQTAVRTQQRPVSWSEILPQTTLKFGDSFALVMGGVQPVDSHALIESPRELLERMVTDLLPIVEEVAQPDAPMRKEETDFHLYPYWRFLPPYVTNLPVNGTVKALGGSCFPHSSAHASWNGVDPAMTVSIELGHPTSRFPPCGDHYLLATLEGLHLRSLRPEPFRRAVHFHWPLHSSLSAAERSDLLANGIRVFRFSLPPAETLHSLKATLLLFRPLTARRPDALAERSNLDFLAKYRGVVLPPVEGPLDPLDVSKVRDGDLFNILRLDGLDPMLASTDGHEAVIFHDEHGEPYVYEATTKSSHWPTNGLQRTPLRLWLKQAQAAGYNVMYSTLSAASREALNSTAALEWFSGVEGVNYGYENILFTWIDTVKDNLPCL